MIDRKTFVRFSNKQRSIQKINNRQRIKYKARWKNQDPRKLKTRKRCKNCEKTFGVKKFSINRSNPDGLDYDCSTYVYKYSKRIRAEDPRKQLVYGARKRARDFGLAFNITRNDIIIPEKCPVLGIPIKPGKGKLHRGSPTIDRTDSNKGYTKNNVKVISHRANTIKSNATIAELLKVVEYLRDVGAARK